MAAPGALMECRRTIVSSMTISTMANAWVRKDSEFVIGGPVAAEGDAAEGAGDPAFGRDQAAAEQFEEAAPRAGRHDRQKVGNPL